MLSSNHFTAIDPIEDAASSSIRALKHLALASNFLATWTDIDRISHWCPELESLTLAGNPLVEGDYHNVSPAKRIIDPCARDIHDGICQTRTWARTRGSSSLQEFRTWLSSTPQRCAFRMSCPPSLFRRTHIGATCSQITPQERADCELYYLSYVSKHGPADDAAKLAEHPRWRELCESEMRSKKPSPQITADILRISPVARVRKLPCFAPRRTRETRHPGQSPRPYVQPVIDRHALAV